MKNFFKLFGIIALVAVIGFSMVACNDGSGSNGNSGNSGNSGNNNANPFLGTWEGADCWGGDNLRAVAGSSTFTISWPALPILGTEKYSYTYSGNTAAILNEGVAWGSATVTGSIMFVNVTGEGTMTLTKK